MQGRHDDLRGQTRPNASQRQPGISQQQDRFATYDNKFAAIVRPRQLQTPPSPPITGPGLGVNRVYQPQQDWEAKVRLSHSPGSSGNYGELSSGRQLPDWLQSLRPQGMFSSEATATMPQLAMSRDHPSAGSGRGLVGQNQGRRQQEPKLGSALPRLDKVASNDLSGGKQDQFKGSQRVGSRSNVGDQCDLQHRRLPQGPTVANLAEMQVQRATERQRQQGNENRI